MEWGRKGRKEESETFPSSNRGRKGVEGETTLIFCDVCHCATPHVLKIIHNPHPRGVWECQKCKKHQVPGRIA